MISSINTLGNCDIGNLIDFASLGFCPACGPHNSKPHQSYRYNGAKISLKSIKSLKDLTPFIDRDPKDLRRTIIAETIKTLGERYFSDPTLKKNVQRIFNYTWKDKSTSDF